MQREKQRPSVYFAPGKQCLSLQAAQRETGSQLQLMVKKMKHMRKIALLCDFPQQTAAETNSHMCDTPRPGCESSAQA